MTDRGDPLSISLRHDWARGEVPLGSTVDQQPEGNRREVVRQSRGEVSRQAKFSQPIPENVGLILNQGNIQSPIMKY